jgi:hypothetical protein
MLGSVASLRHCGYVQVQFFVDGGELDDEEPSRDTFDGGYSYMFVSCFQTPRVREMTFINCMDKLIVS